MSKCWVGRLLTMRECTLGEKLLKLDSELGPQIENNRIHIKRLQDQIVADLHEIAFPLSTNQGSIRIVTGTAIETDAIPKDIATVVNQPMLIERAGLSTPDEMERFGIKALVMAVFPEEDVRRAYYFNPFRKDFDMRPIETDES